MAWTEERVALLAKLWGEGLSATQCAEQLGGVTRSAVCGRVHRDGLTRSLAGEPSPPPKPASAPSVAAQPLRLRKTTAPRKRTPKPPPPVVRYSSDPASQAVLALLGAAKAAEARCNGFRATR